MGDLLDAWVKKTNGNALKQMWSGAYCQFQSLEQVLSVSVDGDFDEDTPCALTSCSKVFCGMAMMRTMHLRPDDWYPEKYMHEFPGWELWQNFAVLDNEQNSDGKGGWSGKTANVTIHQLLTHTNGWPFGLRGKRTVIREVALYFEPGTGFGYSIGHRILGWMLLDYWKAQPEGAEFQCLNDVFKFLVYDPLGLTGTYFIKGIFDHPHSVMGEFFDMGFFDRAGDSSDDDPADLAMASTGGDMMKVAMVALRKGQLPDGTWFVAPEQWAEWAGRNQLPGGKLSQALTSWRMEMGGKLKRELPFLWRTAVTRDVNAGPFGWNYFGATYHDYEGDEDAGPVTAIGWKGFSSCGLRADYTGGVAFVAMQECVPDPGSRNLAECIHKGKVGEFGLGDVGRQLASLDQPRLVSVQAKACCLPFRQVMMRTQNPPCCLAGVQAIVRGAFSCLLPVGVRVLDFHRCEMLDADRRSRASRASSSSAS